MKPRIVIVEDEVIVSKHLMGLAESIGCEVVGRAQDADTAFKIIEEHDPDLVCIDITLKHGRDGISLATQVREEFQTRIVFITSHSDSETLERIAIVGQDGYLLKPFSEEAVKATLSLVLFAPPPSFSKLDLAALSKVSSHERTIGQVDIQKIEDFVEKNFDEKIRLTDIAGLVDMSEGHFSRRFKETFKMTPYQYVLHKRLEEAKRLLRNTELSLVDIADSIGFGSQAHFSSTFKKSTGISPLAYRKMS
ncbi:MAG: DNA-binding response regulator [Pseudomonadota bacterium]